MSTDANEFLRKAGITLPDLRSSPSPPASSEPISFSSPNFEKRRAEKLSSQGLKLADPKSVGTKIEFVKINAAEVEKSATAIADQTIASVSKSGLGELSSMLLRKIFDQVCTS
jgi:hypothetical protein